jgi:signal transduction histidine kinase
VTAAQTTFRVSARTVLHLGSELISSDAIAFYELIKNAFDAGSPRIDVDVKIRIQQDLVVIVRELLREEKSKASGPRVKASMAASMRQWLTEGLIADAPDVGTWRQEIERAASYRDFETILDDANEIVIADKGHGMSLKELKDVYLTIGTPVRSIQRRCKEAAGRPVLGEKGVGRLSMMRLGDKVSIRTAKAGEGYWNLLEIDWRRFSEDEGALIESVKLAPIVDRDSTKAHQEQGTTITIRVVKTVWTEASLKEGVGREVARMMDPFISKVAFPVHLRFNTKAVEVQRFDKVLFAHAHMSFHAKFERDGEGLLYLDGELAVRHKTVDRRERISVDGQTLKNVLVSVPSETADNFAGMTLRRLGPFSVTLYWFNRQRLTAIDGIGTKEEVKDLVNRWAGGLMLFRDGFRVGSYGAHDDDWLDLDKAALSRGGYKMNKAQFVGKVDIGATNNPYLIDQTNREGLRDNEEKDVFRRLLKWVIVTFLYQKMAAWEKAVEAAEPEKVVEKKIEAAKRSVERAVVAAKRLTTNDGHDQKKVTEEMNTALADVREVLPQVRRFVERAAKDRSEIVHLAGIGLLLEIIAHELTRSVINSLGAIKQGRKLATGPLARSLMVLEAGLRTIEKRLRLLDPLSTAGRQRKESFDVIEWVRLITDSHEEQMEATGIKLVLRVEGRSKGWPVKMVKGMFVQILENLLNNSVYWLRRVDKKKAGKRFFPKIEIVLQPETRTIRITDNGPGIAEARAEDVFNAFYTERPEGESHGLGLYISREVASYNDATLILSAEPVIHPGRFNSLVLTLAEA